MSAERRPPPDRGQLRRGVAEGAGKSLDRAVPPDGDGLGPVGEEFVRKLMDDSEQEEQSHKLFMRFTPRWRQVIRWFDDEKLDALQEIVRLLDDEKLKALDAILDEYIERQAMRRVWRRVWGLLVILVPGCFAAAQYGIDKLPLIRSVLNLFRGVAP